MLKKRSIPASSGGAKQSLMSEKYSLSSPKPPNPTLFPSPRVFGSPKGFADGSADAVFAMSPTSILETTKPFIPFLADTKNPTTKKPVGLGIADALKEPSRPESRMVLFGSQLRIQVPSLSTTPVESLQSSPIEFGIKNKSIQLALHSPAAAATRRSTTGPAAAAADLVSGSLSATEMEMSEDYTRVIAHGPNPKTTHIFDNCVVESCCRCGKGFVPAAATRKEKEGSVPAGGDFLNSCDACRKSLQQGKDVFTYRGEKAFCSVECRYQEMLFDEDMEDCESDQTAIL